MNSRCTVFLLIGLLMTGPLVLVNELKAEGVVQQKEVKTAPASLTSMQNVGRFDGNQIKACKLFISNIVTNYRELYKYLPIQHRSSFEAKKSALLDMIRLNEKTCLEKMNAESAIRITTQAVSAHSGKIGIIMPRMQQAEGVSGLVLSGMQAYFTKQQISFDQRVILTESMSDRPETLLAKLAELIFIHRVAIIIGGLEKQEVPTLEPWGDRLMVPVLLLSAKNGYKYSRNVFHVFPNPEDLALRIIQYLQGKNYKRVAILKPIRQKPSRVVHVLRQILMQNKIAILQDISYNPADYTSMEASLNQVFQIDRGLRTEEYQELITKAKDKAEAEKLPFYPERVQLLPKIDFDALIIPDNFRNVRHLAQIMKFLKVKNLSLIGTQEWRSYGLVNPAEPFLRDAVFVDYIGSYQDIPSGISATMQNPPFFVMPEETAKVDYKIIGYQSAKIAEEVLRYPPTKRRKLADRVAQLKNVDGAYFPIANVFTKDHRSIWPTFLFEVKDNAIVPYQGNYGGSLPPQMVMAPSPSAVLQQSSSNEEQNTGQSNSVQEK